MSHMPGWPTFPCPMCSVVLWRQNISRLTGNYFMGGQKKTDPDPRFFFFFFFFLLFAKSHYLHYLQYGLNISLDNTVFYLQYMLTGYLRY